MMEKFVGAAKKVQTMAILGKSKQDEINEKSKAYLKSAVVVRVPK